MFYHRGLEKEMATHSSILTWKIPWTEELAGYSSEVAKSQIRLSDLSTAHATVARICKAFLID